MYITLTYSREHCPFDALAIKHCAEERFLFISIQNVQMGKMFFDFRKNIYPKTFNPSNFMS